MGGIFPGGGKVSNPSVIKMNALGDSILNYSCLYQPANIPTTLAPAWQASTAYPTVGTLAYANGAYYRVITGGTSTTGSGPTGTAADITDGTVHWAYMGPNTFKTGNSILFWTEAVSGGQLVWDMTQGYAGTLNGLLKVIVTAGGQNYANTDTITANNGAVLSPTFVNGGLASVSVVNPGYGTAGFTFTINTSTGSGATLSGVWGPTGTFSVVGCLSSDMVARLPDAVASSVDLFLVCGGTNDIGTMGSSNFNSVVSTYTTIVTNLRTCYETLVANGKKVIAIPILPRTGLVRPQRITLERVNRWIRSYCAKEPWANPLGVLGVELADPTGYMIDGTSVTSQPIGGGGGLSGAMMLTDGLHQSQRGAQYVAFVVSQAASQFFAAAPPYFPRTYTSDDGGDPAFNPGGNMLEGNAWYPNNYYTVGANISNDTAPVKVYTCSQTGTTAGAGGPTGTGTGIVDGTAKWDFVRNQGTSVFTNGTGGTCIAHGGVTYSGNFANHFYMDRLAGSATTLITGAIENPWSNGQIGKRQSLAWSFASGGTNNESWYIILDNGTYQSRGIQASDLGVTSFYAVAELELSALSNFSGVTLQWYDSSAYSFSTQAGPGLTGTGAHLINSSGEPLSYPNNGKLVIKTPPAILPAVNAANVQLILSFSFDCSLAAATAVTKINYVGLHRTGVS